MDITPEYFVEPVHGEIFRCAAELIGQGQAVSPLSLKSQFPQQSEYLYDLAAEVPSVINISDYARQVTDFYHRRRIDQIADEAKARAEQYSFDDPAASIIADMEEGLLSLTERDGEGPAYIDAVSDATMAQIEAAVKGGGSGIPTGLDALDQKIGGLQGGYLYIVAGATSMGKSALAGGIADYAARGGAPVFICSLEMSKEQLHKRSIARNSGVGLYKLDRGYLDPAELQRAADSANTFRGLPIFIDDYALQSASTLRHRARRIQRKHGLKLLVVDYLQLLLPPSGHRSEGRVQEVAKITRSLKAIALDLDIAVIALSQLSRAVDSRDDHRPKLSDLRESGSIEQDADVVIFVHRPEKYLRDSRPDDDEKLAAWGEKIRQCEGKAEIIVAKQRQGPLGECLVGFNGETTEFHTVENWRNVA